MDTLTLARILYRDAVAAHVLSGGLTGDIYGVDYAAVGREAVRAAQGLQRAEWEYQQEHSSEASGMDS